jgi:hypothetical protein
MAPEMEGHVRYRLTTTLRPVDWVCFVLPMVALYCILLTMLFELDSTATKMRGFLEQNLTFTIEKTILGENSTMS